MIPNSTLLLYRYSSRMWIYTHTYMGKKITMVFLSEQFYQVAAHFLLVPFWKAKLLETVFWSGNLCQQPWKHGLVFSDQCFLPVFGGSQQRWPQIGVTSEIPGCEWGWWRCVNPEVFEDETLPSRLKPLVFYMLWEQWLVLSYLKIPEATNYSKA